MKLTLAFFNDKVKSDLLITIFLGLLSALLGFIQFKVPGYENAYTNLREIPLLIALVYINRIWFVILLSLSSLLAVPEGVPYLPNLVMHLIPLSISWFIFKWIESKKLENLQFGIATGLLVLFYYLVLLFPLLHLTYHMSGVNRDQGFLHSYSILFKNSLFEIITTTFVTSLFMIQHEIRKTLYNQNKNLEEIVKNRTFELQTAYTELQTVNEELIAAHEETRSLNENLEELVIKRTRTIDDQLTILTQYAHMNSHQVRGPLARMLGLMILLDKESNEIVRQDLLHKLRISSEELDQVIKDMNRMLDQEIELG